MLRGMAETSGKEDKNYDAKREGSTWDLQGMLRG